MVVVIVSILSLVNEVNTNLLALCRIFTLVLFMVAEVGDVLESQIVDEKVLGHDYSNQIEC